MRITQPSLLVWKKDPKISIHSHTPHNKRGTCHQQTNVWYIYIMKYCSAIKKKEIMPFAATWMQLEIIILSEVSQKEKDKHHMILLIYGI